jgi:NAD(P)-dependent dehydrogenase (short-subunit alcohol dehydrogenase family)
LEIEGKTVFVTGGAGGIGRALCIELHRKGAGAVAIADLNEKDAGAVADEIGGMAIRCNVGKENDVISAVRRIEKEIGPVDICCSNAGIMADGGIEAPNHLWKEAWAVHVMAHVYTARAVIPGMIERGGGAFLITSSAAGLLNRIGSAPYAVTKHAAVGLAENLSITYGDAGIRVSVLCPQAVRTAMIPEAASARSRDGLIEPETVAEAVVEGLIEETFLILPHPEVQLYMERKVSDYDRWLSGMRRLQKRIRG